LSEKFPIQNVLKQDALSPLLYNFALEYAIRIVQENQVCLEMKGTHRLLVYADDINLLGDEWSCTFTPPVLLHGVVLIKKSTETTSPLPFILKI
jgi:hypothetical protein